MSANYERISLLLTYPGRGREVPRTRITLEGPRLSIQGDAQRPYTAGYLKLEEMHGIGRMVETLLEMDKTEPGKTGFLDYGANSVLLAVTQWPNTNAFYVGPDQSCPKKLASLSNRLMTLAGRIQR